MLAKGWNDQRDDPYTYEPILGTVPAFIANLSGGATTNGSERVDSSERDSEVASGGALKWGRGGPGKWEVGSAVLGVFVIGLLL